MTSCSETFVKMTHGKISYKLWAILFTLFSFAVSNVGLSAIIEYSIPVLMLIYPPATALIIWPSRASSSGTTAPCIFRP